MSTKKFGLIASVLFALSVVVTPAFAACDLQHLSECDNAGLLQLIASLGGQTTTTTTTTTTTGSITGIPSGFQFTQTLKQGSTGTEVKYLQIFLNSDADTAVGNAGAETSYFGALTKAAVNKFQTKYAAEILAPLGLTAPTGNWASATRAKANAILAAGGTSTGTGLPAGCTSTAGFSTVTGQPCSGGSTVTLPAGCTSTAGYSPTTGQKCDSTTTAPGSVGVVLSANQPSGTLGENSAYNTVLKASVSAGATSESITSITVQRTGLSIDSNVAGVLVVDQNGVRHGNIVTLANGSATISFSNEPIIIPANTTQEIAVQLNIGTANPLSGTLGMNLTAIASTSSFTGLPLVGNVLTLADTSLTLGAVTVDVVSLTTATVSRDIGTTGYDIQKFRFAAGANEDVDVKSIKIYQNGTVADTDVSNLQLIAPDGTVLATVSGFTNKYATFDLSAAPYRIAKGLTKDFIVRLDVVNGASRTAQLLIQNDYDVVVTGVSTGLNVLPTAGAVLDNSFPIGDIAVGAAGYNHMTIASGSLYVSKSTTSPSGTINIGANSTTIATYKFEAIGENIEIQRVDVRVEGTGLATTDLSGTVRLVTEDGATIWSSSPTATGLVGAAGGVAAGTNIDTLNSYYTITAGTSKTISIVVDTSSTLAATDTIQGKISDIYYKKITTNSYATYSAASYILGNELSASQGTLTVVKNGSLGNSSKVEGQSDVKIGSYLFQTGASEGVNVSSVGIIITGADAADVDASFRNLRLKKSDGTLLGTAVTSPVIDGATANTFTTSGQLNIPVNTTLQVDVYVDLGTAASDGGANDTLTTSIGISGVSGTGATSGAAANGPAAAQTGQVILVVDGGLLTVAMETSGAASSQFLSTGLAGVELGKVKLAATVENMKINRLEVRSINGNGNIASVKLLGTGLSTDPTAVVTSGTAVFTFASGSEIIVPAYGSRVLTVAVDTTNVGTITAAQLGTVGFGTMNAMGEGSGAITQETLTGTSFVAGTNNFTGNIGDVIYFTVAATDGSGAGTAVNTVPGYYMVTAAPTSADLTNAAGSLKLNGDAGDVKWAAGDNVTMLTKVGTDAAVDSMAFALAVGDIVYVHDVSVIANDGFYTVTTAIAATGDATGADTIIKGLNLVVGDSVTKLTNVNALVGNTMRFEEVEPVITKNTSSPSGTGYSASEEVVGIFDVKAEGSRDLTFNSFTIEKGGNNTPARYVVKYSLWNGAKNGANKLSEVITTTATGTTQDGAAGGLAISGTTVTLFSGNISAGGSDELGNISAAEFATIAIGDTVSFYNNAGTLTATVTVTGKSAYPYVSGTSTLTFSATPNVAGEQATVTITNNRVHFDANQAGTGDTALVAQTITAGQTMTLTVKADTTSVKTGLGAGVSGTFFVSVPGSTGPLTTTVGGLNWDYTPLNATGTADYKTQADGYPVNGNSLSY